MAKVEFNHIGAIAEKKINKDGRIWGLKEWAGRNAKILIEDEDVDRTVIEKMLKDLDDVIDGKMQVKDLDWGISERGKKISQLPKELRERIFEVGLRVTTINEQAEKLTKEQKKIIKEQIILCSNAIKI